MISDGFPSFLGFGVGEWAYSTFLASTVKGQKWGPQSREPQEFSRNIMGIYLPGSLYSYCIPGVPSFDVPMLVRFREIWPLL